MPFWCLSCSALQSTSTHAPASLIAAMQRHTTRASRFHSFLTLHACAPAHTRPIATSSLPFCSPFSARHTYPQRRRACEISLMVHSGFCCACVTASLNTSRAIIPFMGPVLPQATPVPYGSFSKLSPFMLLLRVMASS